MVSVCMATYNGEKFIKQQIDSILDQLEPTDELIVSDDNSTDKTVEIISDYNDSRIKLYNHNNRPDFSKIKTNKSFFLATSNFQNALEKANGDYIFLSDQDDIWEEQRILKMTDALKNENADCVMCNFSTIDENGKIIQEKGFKKNPIKKTLIGKIIKPRFFGSSMAFTKALLKKTMPFPKNLRAHDLWIACFSKNFIFIDESLTRYRRHENNVSTGIGKSTNTFLYKIAYRIRFIFEYMTHKNHFKTWEKTK